MDKMIFNSRPHWFLWGHHEDIHTKQRRANLILRHSLSIQGCMAAGKTTAARYVEKNMDNFFVSYENSAPLLQEIKRRGLNQNTLKGLILNKATLKVNTCDQTYV